MRRALKATTRRTRSRPDVLAAFWDMPEENRRRAFTQVPDWVMLCEQVTPTAFRLWCILRSMQFENGPGIPPLRLDEVCWLLPGVNGKPTSKTRAREALDCLLGEGLLKDATGEGASRSAPRIYLAIDEPQRPVEWSGAKRKLRGYGKLWRSKA